MAIAFVKNGGVNANKAGSITTMSITVPTGGHAAGNLLAVFFGVNGPAPNLGPTMSDSRGNTYTTLEIPPSGSTLGLSIMASVLTTALLAGDTITATIVVGGGINYARAALSAIEFSGGSITEDVGSATAGGLSAATVTVGPITPPSAATLLLAGLVENTGTTITEDADTAGGAPWVTGPLAQTTGGSVGSNIVMSPAYKLTVSSAAQTYNPTSSTTSSWGACLVALQPVAVATATKKPRVLSSRVAAFRAAVR